MVYISTKRIKGRDYLYAVRSIRLPDGRALKLARRVLDSKEVPLLKGFFDEKQAKLLAEYAEKHYTQFKLPDENALEKIERMRLEYKNVLSSLSPNQSKDLFDRFTTNFTYESNALEGNSLTLKDVAIVIFENAVIDGKSLREIYETRNSREVVDLILKKKLRVSEKDVLKMHSILVRDRGTKEGYKTLPNYIHGRELATTAPETVPEEMNCLFSWFKENQDVMHPLQLAAHLHGRFEKIHPFEDGNGRVGRFLINVVLVSAGYPPLIIRKTQRVSYFNALEDFDRRRPSSLEMFLVKRLKETHNKFFKIYAKYI